MSGQATGLPCDRFLRKRALARDRRDGRRVRALKRDEVRTISIEDIALLRKAVPEWEDTNPEVQTILRHYLPELGGPTREHRLGGG